MADVHHHSETDDLGRAVETSKGIVHCHRLQELEFRFKPVSLTTPPAAFETLLALGANTDARDNARRTILHDAALGDNAHVVEALLESGADANVKDANSNTPLHDAASFSAWEDSLRGHEDRGDTLVVEAPLAGGTDVNARDDRGWTPLRWAARWNHNPAVLELLLVAGADLNARDGLGDTPLDTAQSRPKIREVLQTYVPTEGPAGINAQPTRTVRQ